MPTIEELRQEAIKYLGLKEPLRADQEWLVSYAIERAKEWYTRG